MSKAKLGMLLFLFSETIFFVFLLVAYINFHVDQPHALIISDLDAKKTGVYTTILILSSASAFLAHKSAIAQNIVKFQMWLVATIALGSIFIFGQSREYFRLFNKEITVSRDALSTSFFTVTGFHGLHVCAGILLLVLLLFWSVYQNKSGKKVPFGSVEAISLYWHFVDIVWIAVFSVVYLWGAR
jgi:heme/copper-type cytochrome/quinol oxidase subunit 3